MIISAKDLETSFDASGQLSKKKLMAASSLNSDEIMELLKLNPRVRLSNGKYCQKFFIVEYGKVFYWLNNQVKKVWDDLLVICYLPQ